MESKKNPSIDHGRVYGLDVFRAFAILFVLIGHSFEHSKIPPQLQVFGRLGILGVELFFVLSGFLIGSIIMRLIDKNSFQNFSDIVIFWKRRWLRTLPLYFIALLAFLRFDYHGRHSLVDFPQYFIFMQNFAWKMPEFFELSWSLAIEEHFYFWFPLVFLIWKKITKKTHLPVILTAISFILIAYTYRFFQPDFSDWDEYNRLIRLPVLSRIDAIMFGVLIALINSYWQAGFICIKRLTPFTATLFVMLTAWWFIDIPFLMQSRLLQINLWTLQAVLCAMLLPWFNGFSASVQRNDFFVLTSKLSYSLYLIHILVIILVNNVIGKIGLHERVYNNPFIIYPIYFSLFYFVSWLTYKYIEKPFLEFRELSFSFLSLIKVSWVTILLSCILIVHF